MPNQKEKAIRLRELHHSDKMLVLPNIWDPLGAAMLENLGYPAVATASASVALSNGYPDGEKIPFSGLLPLLKRISQAVEVPVTADVESGFAASDAELEENIERLLETGIVGINIEDTDKGNRILNSIERQSDRVALIRKVAIKKDVPLFINARTDIYIHEKEFPTEAAKLDEIIRRAHAYKAAGADCFFPILIKDENSIRSLRSEIEMPINIIALPGIPSLEMLRAIGINRLSLGPGLLKIAIRAMKETAEKLFRGEGLGDITDNEITSDYLKGLIK